MKKVIMLYLLVIMAFTSCKKTYTYVEVVNRTDILGNNDIALKEEETIRSRSDTSAYLEAYKRFCISLKAYSIMEEQGSNNYLDKPLDFRLLNSNQEDISNISFLTKSDEENRISKRIFSINVNGTDSFSKEKKSTIVKVHPNRMDSICKQGQFNEYYDYFISHYTYNSEELEKIISHFNIKKDEFDTKGWAWFIPKSAPRYKSQDGIYLYFGVRGIENGPLRLVVQYSDEDWLFIEKLQFLINGKVYDYLPRNIHRDNDYEIWEWFDDALTLADKDMIKALSEAKSAKIKFIGREYYDIRFINHSQIIDIKRTLDLYNRFGGNF